MHSCSRCRRWGMSQLVSVGLSWSWAGKGGASRLSAGRQASLELLVSLLGGDLPQTHMCPPLSCLMMQKIKLIGWLGQETIVSVTQGSVIESTSALVVWRDSKGKSLWWAVRFRRASANLSTSQENNLSSTLSYILLLLSFPGNEGVLPRPGDGHWEARQVCEVGGAGQVQRGDWSSPKTQVVTSQVLLQVGQERQAVTRQVLRDK